MIHFAGPLLFIEVAMDATLELQVAAMTQNDCHQYRCLPQRRVLYAVLWGLAVLPPAGITYLASYAPYLRFVEITRTKPIPYRSPNFYRGAEWFLHKVPPARPVMMYWAGCFNVEDEMGFQAWLFGQGISDLSEMDFHIVN